MLEASSKYQHDLRWLKRWIWIYFWLLIFEGALRKWFITSLSGPLLLVRDPVAVIVYIQAVRCHKFSMKTLWPFALLTMLMVLLACAQILAGIDTPQIAAYGLRAYLLHLPLIFVMADTLEEEDLRSYGRALLALSVPMAFLVLAQFRASGAAWLNAGAGEGAGQIMSAGNHIRPAGTFSYGIGMQGFLTVVAAFVLDALTRKGIYPAWLVYSGLLACIAMIPLLGSRTVMFLMIFLAVLTFFSGVSHAARLAGLLKVFVVVILACMIALQFPFFHEAIATFQERWTQASAQEGDVQEVFSRRVFGTFENGIEYAGETPWLGRGIGMGSNYAAVVTTGEAAFMLGENEWERVIPELGPICGLLFMGARVAFALYLVLRARHALSRGVGLAWLLLPAAVPLLVMGIMEQTTYLGFMVFSSGLCLAAAQNGRAAALAGNSGAV